MARASENSPRKIFHRAFRGYKRKEVEEYILRLEQENAATQADQLGRITLLVQENEHAAQMLHALQDEHERLLADNEEYKKQLKESSATVQMLYDRLNQIGSETERLQDALNDFKKNASDHDPTADEWKQRALTAEETVRRLAEAELNANAERENAHHIRLPFGKKAYLDMTLHKNDKDI